MKYENNESGNIRFNIAILGSLLLMAPLTPQISAGDLKLVDILLRWGIAFCFVGAIVTMLAFAFAYQPQSGLYARPHELEPSMEEVEAAIREFSDQSNHTDDYEIADAELLDNNLLSSEHYGDEESYRDHKSTMTHDFGDGPMDTDIAEWASGADAQPSNRRATDH